VIIFMRANEKKKIYLLIENEIAPGAGECGIL
jgi:hypothetical protein